MAVRPYRNKAKEIIPGKWEIDLLPNGKKGKRFRRIFAGTEAQALAREAEYIRAIKKNARAENPILKNIFFEFIESYEIDHQPSTVKSVKDAWVHLEKGFGKLRLAEIVNTDVDDYKKTRLKDGVKKRSINKELSYLSSILSWAEEQNYVRNPLKPKRFPAKQTKAPTPRIPGKDTLNGLLDNIEPHYLAIALLYCDAGLRRREALDLTRQSVDIDNDMLIIIGKGDKERIVPITTPRLRKAIKKSIKEISGRDNRDVAKEHRDFLFLNLKTNKPYYSIRKALIRAAEKAGIDGRVYTHLLRHYFGTNAMVSGVDLRAAQGMMGHSSSQVTEMYQHIAADYLKKEAKKIAASNGGGKKSRKSPKTKAN